MSYRIKDQLQYGRAVFLILFLGFLWIVTGISVSAETHPELLTSLTEAPGAVQVSSRDLLDGMYIFSPQITENTWMSTSGNWDQEYLRRLNEVRPDLMASWWPMNDVSGYSNCASKIALPSDRGNLWVEYHNVGTYLGHTITMRITFLDWEYDSELPAEDYAYIAVTMGENQGSYPATPNVEIKCLEWIEAKYEFLDEEGRSLDVKGHFTLCDLDYSQGFLVESAYDGMYFNSSSASRNKYEPGTGCVWNTSNNATLPSNSNGWITYTFSGNEIIFRFYEKNKYNPSYKTYNSGYPDWMDMYQLQQTADTDTNNKTVYPHELWFWRGISRTGYVYKKNGIYYADQIEGSELDLTHHGWAPSEYGFTSKIPLGGYTKKGNVVLTKTDSLTGQRLAGAEFTCFEWNGSEFVEYGQLVYHDLYDTYYLENLTATGQNQGKFKIVETSVPEGYKDPWSGEFQITQAGLTTFTFEAENTPVTGTIRIRKTDRETGAALSGAIFGLWAKQDILSPTGVVIYPAGTYLGEFPVVDETGTTALGGILPGCYEVEELTAPPGYVRDTNRYPVELQSVSPAAGTEESETADTEEADSADTDQTAGAEESETADTDQTAGTDDHKAADTEGTDSGKETEVTAPEVTCQLPNSKNRLTLWKTGCIPEREESIPLAEVSFKIWHESQEEMAGTIYRTDTEGKLVLEGLKAGVWYLREEETLPGFALDRQTYQVTVDENGLINGQAEAEIRLVNHAITLEISKEDAVSGQLVPGARFQLYNDQNLLVRSFTTTDQPYLISCLSPGTYLLKELQAPSGYVLHDPVSVTITETAERQKLAVPETPLVSLRLKKKIDVSEITWQHGEPTFFLNVTGEDLDGRTHTYHVAFCFTQEYVEAHTSADGTVTMEQVLENIPAGECYTITETDTLRYGVWMVTGSENASITMLSVPEAGKKNDEIFSVTVDLTKPGQNPYVCFWNRKYRWDDYSHTSLKVNTFRFAKDSEASDQGEGTRA